MSITNN